MKYGLSEATVEKIHRVFARFPEIEQALLYGSRAKGNFKTGSDIDLTLYGAALTSDLRASIAADLDDLLLPYDIDLSIFDQLDHRELEAHIKRVGIVFYERAAGRLTMNPIDFARISRARLPALLCQAPKAELHIHIEGSLEPELIFKLAQRNGLTLAYPNVEALRAAYAFTDLQSFLDIYYAGASVLLHEQDFFDMAWAYFERAAADHVVHAELFFDPQTHTARGVDIGIVIRGLQRACRHAQTELGISASLILCFLRHLSEADALATLEAALPLREHFIGVGLDSSERGNPPEKFARVFARARALGLKAVAHAGEEGPPAYIESALDVLKVQRIDHGVRCVDSPALVERLAAERIPLTVCPLSNVKLCVFKQMAEHNLPALLAAGLCATINSDDPAYFGGYLNDNFIALFAALPQLGAREAYQLLRNSFEASFATDEAKAGWIAQLDTAFRAAVDAES